MKRKTEDTRRRPSESRDQNERDVTKDRDPNTRPDTATESGRPVELEELDDDGASRGFDK